MTEQERKDALAAAGILRNDVFAAAVDALDARYVAGWRAAQDAQEREQWWHRQAALKDVQDELFATIQSAAVRTRGKDDEVNQALSGARARRSRKNG